MENVEGDFGSCWIYQNVTGSLDLVFKKSNMGSDIDFGLKPLVHSYRGLINLLPSNICYLSAIKRGVIIVTGISSTAEPVVYVDTYLFHLTSTFCFRTKIQNYD